MDRPDSRRATTKNVPMCRSSSILNRARIWFFVAAGVLSPMCHAAADNFLGLYVGGALGQAHVEASGEQIIANGRVYSYTGNFDQSHLAFKVLAGIHPIPLLGAEVAYVGFGHPSGSFNANSATVSMHGESAFGVLYLPVPVIDIMLKAGIARMHSEIDGTGYYSAYCLPREECPFFIITSPFRLQHTNTGPAFGAGAQYKFGPLAARAEYERFSAAGEHPSLFSLGLTWSF